MNISAIRRLLIRLRLVRMRWDELPLRDRLLVSTLRDWRPR
jgi:hypothetical protein